MCEFLPKDSERTGCEYACALGSVSRSDGACRRNGFTQLDVGCFRRPSIRDRRRANRLQGAVGSRVLRRRGIGERQEPGRRSRSIQGMSLTDRFEVIAGGFGFTYQDGQARPLDMLIQPKYVIHRSFGIIPSISVAAASLFPLSGNKQHWDSYTMAHISWFLFTPENSTDPYDNDLAIHVNLGTKNRYDAGPATYQMKFYWAAGFEVITFSRELRFLAETFNGDPFGFEEKFPAYQAGFRWYRTPNMQLDFVFRGIRNTTDDVRLVAGGGGLPEEWNYTIQIGFRFLIDVFR
jgi:hypothetical protein